MRTPPLPPLLPDSRSCRSSVAATARSIYLTLFRFNTLPCLAATLQRATAVGQDRSSPFFFFARPSAALWLFLRHCCSYRGSRWLAAVRCYIGRPLQLLAPSLRFAALPLVLRDRTGDTTVGIPVPRLCTPAAVTPPG